VAPFIADALGNSLKLAALAFVLVVPLGIAGGVYAALRAGRWADRAIVLLGQSLGIVPEFISSIVLILIFGVWLRWLPMSADWPDGAGPLTQLYYLILPSLPLVIIFFGYIARVARTGAVEALDADYTRTAVLKGLPWITVLTRHVLRNALLPTITVAASLVGYLAGGLVVVETLFHYRGIGGLIYTAAKAKDFPMLEAGVLTIGMLYTLATLIADLISAALNPRLRSGLPA
jgi:peptide/nickel transport system permease protein